MKNAFGEEMDRQVRVRHNSWPINLAMKLGAKNKAQANLILAIFAIILLTATFIMLKGQPSFKAVDADDYSNAQIQELIDRGINTDDLTPEQKRELEKRGISI
jgi:hypothetical protein